MKIWFIGGIVFLIVFILDLKFDYDHYTYWWLTGSIVLFTLSILPYKKR